jgi:hypothetical protein
MNLLALLNGMCLLLVKPGVDARHRRDMLAYNFRVKTGSNALTECRRVKCRSGCVLPLHNGMLEVTGVLALKVAEISS